ncbi:MAG: transglycosylase domain-containing protein [Xanthobacteraceae bacterium]
MPAAKRRGLFARALRIICVAVLAILLLPYLITPLYRVINPVSVPMLSRWLTGERVERAWVPLSQISPSMRLAAIVAEDGRFCTHHGIDLGEIWATVKNAGDEGISRGASTITQQTVKNLFLWQGRSVIRKGLELPLALWFDFVVPKRRQLEIYLNIAEWGPDGEFGIEAGTRRAFGRSANSLSAGQAALLVGMLPNPQERDARAPGPALRRITAIHLRRMAIMKEYANCTDAQSGG